MRFLLLILLASTALAQSPKLPSVLDPALKLEALCTVSDIESPTTVVGAPDGSFYVGCDPRDGRLNTDKPECYIVRFSSMGAEKKRTVFAKDIYSPAGSAWHDGWLYVAHDPFLTRFRDTDGDGIADVREDLITNLGKQPDTGLNDHLASGFTLGMDGYFYMSIGDRGTYQTKSVKDGSTISMQGGGIIRFRPDGTALEVFSTGTRNHLAVCLDAEDNAFTLDNTDDGNGWWTRLTHHIEGGYYGYPYDYQKAPNYGVTQPSQQTLDAMKRNGHESLNSPPSTPNFLPALADFGPGSPTGGLCYLSDGLPEPYRGKLLFSEWGKGGLFVIEVVRDGATFRFVKNTPLIQGGNGIDFRPMQLSVAADGSLLIADWQWGGWKGPKTVGAVWRLSWPEAKIAPRLKDESKATVEELLAALGHVDREQRLRAQGALMGKKGERAATGLTALAKNERASAVSRIHALRTIEALIAERPKIEASTGGAAFAAMKSATPAVRSAAVRALDQRHVTSFPRDPLATLFLDPDAAVRLATVRAFGHILPRADAGKFPASLVTRTAAGVGDRIPMCGTPLIQPMLLALADADPWVRSVAIGSVKHLVEWSATQSEKDKKTLEIVHEYPAGMARAFAFGGPDPETPPFLREGAQLSLDRVFTAENARELAGHSQDSGLPPDLGVNPPPVRQFAVAALGRIAYKPKPWDGHWWGTQPVKNPPPLPSVAWEGTSAALEALTAALSDPDAGVRLAAAKAFAGFVMPGVDKMGAKGAMLLPPPAIPERAGGSAGASVVIAKAAGGDGSKIATAAGAIATDNAAIVTGNAKIATGGTALATSNATLATSTAVIAADAGKISPPPAASGGPVLDPENAALAAAAQALAVLRERLASETDEPVRRQIIEALGVQKDPLAMEVFRQIALDEKADADFRDAAIHAIVNIGGQDAKKTIAQLPLEKLSSAARRKVIVAVGELRMLEAAPVLMVYLAAEDAGDRLAAIKSLAQLGPKSNATDGLLAALADADAKVQTAAVEALGAFKDKRALPALLDFSKTKRAHRETINAVAALMPDTLGLPFLVDALREKGAGERRAALTALKKMRAEAWPMIEANLASGRIPADVAPEIRAAFDSGAIAKWKMIGPFENVWEAVHPPETDALAGGDFLKKKTLNAEGKETGWNEVSASAGNEGRVDLEKVFHSNGMVCAYAFTEIESPEEADARLLCGSDDQLAVWLNGKKIHDSGPGARGFNADQDDVPLHFAKGRNALLVKIGNVGGGWEFAARIPGLDGGTFTPRKEPAPDVKQRAFSLATNADGSWVNRGDVKRGEKLFSDPGAGLGGVCATCHKVRGLGKEIGPDLSLVGSIYKRGDLVVSILEPSKTIALGFEQNMIETKGGETLIGALRQETGEAFTLVGVDGQSHIVQKTDVKTRKPMEQSLMPPGLTLGLKPEDFADLLAFLETLK